MKLFSVFLKSLKEQYRSFWLLILTVSSAPFFVFVYYLIIQSSQVTYRIELVNNDYLTYADSSFVSYGSQLSQSFIVSDTVKGFEIFLSNDEKTSINKLKNLKSDVVAIIPTDFSQRIIHLKSGKTDTTALIEFKGNITSLKYIVGAIWTYNLIASFITSETGINSPLELKETPVGVSGNRTDFELAIPGLLIFSIIMLMLSASSAMVYESENKTLNRLRLAKISVWQLMGGISAVQLIVGILAVALTLFCALIMGFRYDGSLWLVLFVSVLASLSIIAFCLIIAAFSKTVTQVLIIGNFPLFIFMFFSGAMFPFEAKPLFTLGGYDISYIGLLSPSHAISALQKVMFMQQGFSDIVPECIALIILSIIYGLLGIWAYSVRNLKLEK